MKLWKKYLTGAFAGAVAGLFGAGGGMLLVPMLTTDDNLRDEQVFSASVAIMLPVCVIALLSGGGFSHLPWKEALPYLIGGAIGGLMAAYWGKKIPVKWLHRGLGILILWGGVRNLC